MTSAEVVVLTSMASHPDSIIKGDKRNYPKWCDTFKSVCWPAWMPTILKDDLNHVTFEAEAFLLPLLNTSEVSLHKPTAKLKAYNMSWALWNWTRDIVITLLFLGTTDSLPIILWWKIEIEKRRWQVLVIQWRQWEKCKERVNMTKPTLLWAGDSCLICTLSIRRVIGIGRHIFPPSWKGAQ